MKTIFGTIVVGITIFLFGCDNRTGVSEMSDNQIAIRCLNGVEYYLYRELEGYGYKGYGYMAVKYNPDGKISTCYKN